MKVAIIGGGPSGLVVLKYLTTAHEYFDIEPIEAVLFERENALGGTFKYRVYEDAELVSSKYLTAFSDFRLPEESPDFLTPEQYCAYLEAFVAKFNLEPYIHLGSEVTQVHVRPGGDGHIVTVRRTSNDKDDEVFDWECDAVSVCSGLHVFPDMPFIDGIEHVPEILHSSEVKTRSQFGEGKSVMILGAGETGHDMAHLAVTSPTSSVVLCHRDGFFCGPKIVPTPIVMNGLFCKPHPNFQNKPVDCSAASLFDTAYVPKVLQNSRLLWSYYNNWIKTSQTVISGTPNGPDQWVGRVGKGRNHVDSGKVDLFFCKSNLALPYISEQYRSKSILNRIRSWFINVPLKDTGGRVINIATWPRSINKDGSVVFEESDRPEYEVMKNKVVKPNIVIFATGYKKEFPFLNPDEYQTAMIPNVRGVYDEEDVTVSFIGFIRPSLGAIPPLAEMQTQLWVYRLLQTKYPMQVPLPSTDGKPVYPNAIPPYELDWKLHARGSYDFFSHKGGVDQEAYTYQLALDIGSAPTWTHVLSKGWRVFFTWAMGPNFVTKFRLVGPWKNEEEALRIMKTEQYTVVKRTGGLVYFTTYTLIPFTVFGTLSTTIYAGIAIGSFFKAVGRWIQRLFGRRRVEVE